MNLNRQKNLNIPVVYEDEWLLIVNKPQGLLTVPSAKKRGENLTDILKRKSSLYPCHRLDQETSGLVVYAKTNAVQKKMFVLFKERKIKKIYCAFVQGRIPKDKNLLNFPLEGKPAVTEYEVKERKRDFTVLEVIPHTGRTNQIRLHFKLIGHPLVGEKKFAFRRDYQLKANRLCLHARSLEFVHPVTKRLVAVSVDLPRGMQNFLAKYPD